MAAALPLPLPPSDTAEWGTLAAAASASFHELLPAPSSCGHRLKKQACLDTFYAFALSSLFFFSLKTLAGKTRKCCDYK
nr:hypothetical protein Itr_chr11CG24140 [Ipomoea trifida]